MTAKARQPVGRTPATIRKGRGNALRFGGAVLRCSARAQTTMTLSTRKLLVLHNA